MSPPEPSSLPETDPFHATGRETRQGRLRRLLEEMVVPAFDESLREGEGVPENIMIDGDGDEVCLRGMLGEEYLVQVTPSAIDRAHTRLRFSMIAGVFVGDIATQALLVGNLLEPTPFHVQADYLLGNCGQMMVGCDLVVRDDDEPLVRRRVAELLRFARDLDWFFPLRMPGRIRWPDSCNMEIPWQELPHGELDGFLDAGLQAPPAERTPVTLLWLAMGLLRWKDVLRLLREHPGELPLERFAPLKAMAHRELERWTSAVRTAEKAGIENGRYEGAPWISPSYIHSLIEVGKDIEALRILGKPVRGEPGFYDWMRGLALHRAGDHDGAGKAFRRYFKRWPGDIIGLMTTEALVEQE